MLLDPSMQVHVRFRLGGARFPPMIYYKVFTHGAVADICAFAPRDYAAERAGRPRLEEDRYLRNENNGWRPLVCRLQAKRDEVEKITARRLRPFHHSRLQRRQDLERRRRHQKAQWIRTLYAQSEAVPVAAESDPRPVTPEDLVQWSQEVEFEAYMDSWMQMATSDVSEGTLPIGSARALIPIVHGT